VHAQAPARLQPTAPQAPLLLSVVRIAAPRYRRPVHGGEAKATIPRNVPAVCIGAAAHPAALGVQHPRLPWARAVAPPQVQAVAPRIEAEPLRGHEHARVAVVPEPLLRRRRLRPAFAQRACRPRRERLDIQAKASLMPDAPPTRRAGGRGGALRDKGEGLAVDRRPPCATLVAGASPGASARTVDRRPGRGSIQHRARCAGPRCAG